jgi:Tol biopolymer transport system component
MTDDFPRRDPWLETPAPDGDTEDLGFLDSTEAGGPQLPRYQVVGLIGIGGMGVVYRAEDTRLGRTVALKFLPPMSTPNPRTKARFLNEARAAAALDHPNICTIYEVGETAEGQLYLAMAFYEGETLKRRLERGPLTVVEALHAALQVARGLADAHQRGIVHRDIKPANLMITTDGLVKILDFGIAQLPDESLAVPLLGTPDYMSPQQGRGGAVDARCDVWSLGVVLHEMLTGRLPSRVGQEESLPLEELCPGAPRGTAALLSRMLAEEPVDRYPNAGSLLADLTALKRVAAGTAATFPPDLGQRRFLAWPVLAAAVLVLTLGFWLLRGVPWHVEAGSYHPIQATFDQLTDLPGREWFPSLDPEGKFFVYAKVDGDKSRLFLRHVGGGKDVPLLADSEDGSQPSLSPDGQQIAFRSEREGGGIFLMGLMGESVRRVTESGFNPTWSPDGKEILYATDGIENPLIRRFRPSQIFRINLVTRQLRLVHKGDAVQPSWSPHGFRIAYWGTSDVGDRVIWTISAGGGEAVPVTDGKSIDWNPVWSHDGRYLYFASDRTGVTNLWRVPIDERSGKAGEPESVTTSAQASMLLSLSRDDKRIAYTADDTKTILEKLAFNPESGTLAGSPSAITRNAQIIMTCDVSPDGSWILYQTGRPQNLFLIHPDGSGLRQLTADSFKNRQPRWSPDGKRIAFYSNRGGKHYEIWLLRADGSELERAAIFPDKTQAFHPIWSPNGRQLAFDFGENEALIDLTQTLAKRRPLPLPAAGPGLGFSASFWSPDGRWLAGALHLETTGRRQVPGVVLYSLLDKTYVRLTDRGEGAIWLSDSRHLLYWDDERLLDLDTLSKTSRQVLVTPRGSAYNDLCLSPDERVLYLARNTEESDIWLLTMK